ncbi:MAG: alpha/beta hydrolase [Burkholderiaceae bacterium]
MRLLLTTLALGLAAVVSSCGGGGNGTQGGGGGGGGVMYQSTVYATGEIGHQADIVYSHRPNAGRAQYTSDARKAAELGTDTLTLVLDVWTPPSNGGNRPLVVWVHGGGFNSGGKEDRSDDALSYARAGYVTASVNYRLTANNDVDAPTRTLAIEQAADDVMNAIRYLKANAASLHIDTSRVAVVGTSAGGALALVDAVEPDTLDNTLSDYPGQSAAVSAVVSTGATLVDPLFDTSALLSYDRDDAPVLLFHAKPQDGTTHATWDGNVVPTQTRIDDSGNSCTTVATANGGHTVSLAMDGSYWTNAVQPFLWQKLRLAQL